MTDLAAARKLADKWHLYSGGIIEAERVHLGDECPGCALLSALDALEAANKTLREYADGNWTWDSRLFINGKADYGDTARAALASVGSGETKQ